MSPFLFVFVLHVPPKCLIHHRKFKKKRIIEGRKNGKKEGREVKRWRGKGEKEKEDGR